MRRIFVHGRVGLHVGTYCSDCIPERLRERLGDGDVDTWEEFSDGWLTAPVCQVCKLSIPVYCDGER